MYTTDSVYTSDCLHRGVWAGGPGWEQLPPPPHPQRWDKGLPISCSGGYAGGLGSDPWPPHASLEIQTKFRSRDEVSFLFSLRKSGFPAWGEGWVAKGVIAGFWRAQRPSTLGCLAGSREISRWKEKIILPAGVIFLLTKGHEPITHHLKALQERILWIYKNRPKRGSPDNRRDSPPFFYPGSQDLKEIQPLQASGAKQLLTSLAPQKGPTKARPSRTRRVRVLLQGTISHPRHRAHWGKEKKSFRVPFLTSDYS